MEPTDADLLRRAAAGDKDSFAMLFERYQPVVYRFARAMIGCPAAAEDVTQEVFIVLIREMRRYAPERAALSTYLYGIARNLSRDRLRREQRFLSMLSLGSFRVVGGTVDPFDHLATTQTTASVRRALARIPLKYREVVILCDLHELSYAEVGTILRASTAAVRSRLHRGRHLLRQRLSRPAQAARPLLACERLVRDE